jgi:4-hydroxy-tetrahydrodipicolinate reductase
MKIALIGYGKMGKAIEQIAINRGHQISLIISEDNLQDMTTENLKNCDVAIEFTNPESAVKNIKTCINANVPVVCGSTGWVNEEEAVKKYCADNNGTLLFASNFSIGVNIFFEINKKLASLLNTQKNYNVQIVETHHTAKKDAPSGTAITLAQQIINVQAAKDGWVLNSANPNANEVNIESLRIDPAPGTHHIKYLSSIDDIEIIHTAHNREGFALGAVVAAEFIYNKQGLFTMQDVLQIN